MKPKRQKYNDDDVKEDRLSNLPDFVLLHILSFMDTKRAVQTCILSKRWKNIWNHLPSLTLHSWCFSNYKNNLIIQQCTVPDPHTNNLCISSATLVNLTIETYYRGYCKVELSTPSLCTFVFDCTGIVPALCGSNNNVSSVKHVNINVMGLGLANSTKVSLALLTWLVELANIKSLIITSSALEVLSLVPDLLKVEFRSLCNLKLLKLKSRMGLPLSIPNGALYFLLQNSPSAKVQIIH